jgi:hypothetical protein
MGCGHNHIFNLPLKYCHSPTQPQHELELDLIMGTFKALPGNLGSSFLVYNLILTQLERQPQNKWKRHLKINKMEDDLNKN